MAWRGLWAVMRCPCLRHRCVYLCRRTDPLFVSRLTCGVVARACSVPPTPDQGRPFPLRSGGDYCLWPLSFFGTTGEPHQMAGLPGILEGVPSTRVCDAGSCPLRPATLPERERGGGRGPPPSAPVPRPRAGPSLYIVHRRTARLRSVVNVRLFNARKGGGRGHGEGSAMRGPLRHGPAPCLTPRPAARRAGSGLKGR